ncbi:MAG: hypothetical protein MR761_01320, partial [Butyricicoccus porcorum]|nr:hypothetical protein [Butyricicoccus porcorum]
FGYGAFLQSTHPELYIGKRPPFSPSSGRTAELSVRLFAVRGSAPDISFAKFFFLERKAGYSTLLSASTMLIFFSEK